MGQFHTRQLGTVEYEPDSVLEFPGGLPAFDDERQFVLIEKPESAPVIFLQSLSNPDLCFCTVPVQCVDADYRLNVSEEELKALGSQDGTEGLLTLTILTLREDHAPTANLMAPVVIDRKTRRARQVIQYDSGYEFEKPLFGEGS